MIKEDYISYEVAKLLKEKGFNEPVTELNKLLFKESEKPVLKITHQKAMKWLREVHNVHICPRPFNPELPVIIGKTKYTCDIGDTKHSFRYGHIRSVWNTYEEACEAAIKYCLENLI